MEVDPVEVARIMPEPVLIPREEAEKLFEQLSPETKKMMDDLAAWRARSARADIWIGVPAEFVPNTEAISENRVIG